MPRPTIEKHPQEKSYDVRLCSAELMTGDREDMTVSAMKVMRGIAEYAFYDGAVGIKTVHQTLFDLGLITEQEFLEKTKTTQP